MISIFLNSQRMLLFSATTPSDQEKDWTRQDECKQRRRRSGSSRWHQRRLARLRQLADKMRGIAIGSQGKLAHSDSRGFGVYSARRSASMQSAQLLGTGMHRHERRQSQAPNGTVPMPAQHQGLLVRVLKYLRTLRLGPFRTFDALRPLQLPPCPLHIIRSFQFLEISSQGHYVSWLFFNFCSIVLNDPTSHAKIASIFSGFSVGRGRSQEDIYKDLQSAGAGWVSRTLRLSLLW